MPVNTQAGRLMAVMTPLGPDALLLEGLTGAEAVSELYEYTLDLLAEPGTVVAFEALLGKPAVVALNGRDQTARYLTGIVSRLTEGGEVRTARSEPFVRYRAVLVPPLWLLTRRRQSRIFQHLTVPAILKRVLAGLDVRWNMAGEYEPRDYCVQYRETGFAFASRLMEEEGVFYFFDHTAGRHTLVVADHPGSHPPVPDRAALLYDAVVGGTREEDRITGWVKSQEVRTGKHTLWDHCFELPGNNLEVAGAVQPTVAVGTVAHALTAGGADLEAYDYPGGFAQRFDGIDPGRRGPVCRRGEGQTGRQADHPAAGPGRSRPRAEGGRREHLPAAHRRPHVHVGTARQCRRRVRPHPGRAHGQPGRRGRLGDRPGPVRGRHRRGPDGPPEWGRRRPPRGRSIASPSTRPWTPG